VGWHLIDFFRDLFDQPINLRFRGTSRSRGFR
jgi:hypothetical protein